MVLSKGENGAILDPEDRLRQAIGATGLNNSAFAEKAGIPLPSLKKYLSGKSRPGFEALALISAATSRSIDWLVTGEEKSKNPGTLSMPDTVLLERVIEAVETHLEKRRKRLKPPKKARLIALLYERFYEKNDLDETYIESLVSIAA